MKQSIHTVLKPFYDENGTLCEQELLSCLLSYATKETTAKEHASMLLSRIGKLSLVLATPLSMLKEAGISESEAALLSLLLPLKRRAWEEVAKKKSFEAVEEIGQYFVRLYGGFSMERVYMMTLNEKMEMIRTMPVSDGSVNSVSFQSRAIVEKAFAEGATYAVLAHNHPRGELEPSQEDVYTTAALVEAFDTVGISLLEHIVVAQGAFMPLLLESPTLLPSPFAPANFYSAEQLAKAKANSPFTIE